MMTGGMTPLMILNQKTKQKQGRKVQLSNVSAAKAVADVIRTCLGPRSMLKMLMDPMGGILMTNDGNCILREITVEHPGAKSMIEISRTQDEEVGDGTTSVIILAGEMLSVAAPFLEESMHPTVIISAYRRALEDILHLLNNDLCKAVDVKDKGEMTKIVRSSINTKAIKKWEALACDVALEAANTVLVEEDGRKEIDIKRYVKVEKVPGGTMEESCVLRGVMVEKDVVHPKMRRRIENPRVLLLDCGLEYKKGESQTNVEIMEEQDFSKILQLEEDYIEQVCGEIIAAKPDLLITEKGVSDLAQHYLVKAGISVLRRVRKSDNNRIARATGATVVNQTDEIKEEDIGKQCGLFEIKKFGDEYFTFLVECSAPKACTILLRGASKEILKEIEQNLHDALSVARSVLLQPKLCAGGGAIEMALAQALSEKSKSLTDVAQGPYRAVGRALEIIPQTLAANCGANTIRTLTALRAKHAGGDGGANWGINGETGELVDMESYGCWDPLAVKAQVYKTAIETAILLLRIDDIVSGSKKQSGEDAKQAPREPAQEAPEPADAD